MTTGEYKELEDGSLVGMNVDIFGQEVVEDNGTSGAEMLGGILLSPLFYLINFVADAILSNVGSIMMGQGFSSGIGILTINVPQSNYKNSVEVPVDTSTFTPDNIIGGLVSGSGNVSFQYPNIKYSPEEIFAGKIDLLSIDFISGKNFEGDPNKSESWLSIRKVISQWYQVLRMVAIIGLLSVLIYTGIKIIISANAKDKAKYKEWIVNWLIAVAILFAMHYIMAFIIAVTGEISKLLGQSFQGIKVVPSTGGSAFTTNLIGLVRFMIQSENFYIKVGYEVMYIALIVYTIKFTFLYLKRVLNMAFLTLIAPIVALTYPIDKINDGKAQGFDMWLKEYIFNAILQPMHFILYYILVGSAVSIAASNPLYGIAVLAFLSEGERLLKRIFGFDKAGGGTVGGIAGAFATGAIASKAVDFLSMSKLGGKNSSGGDKNNFLNNAKPTMDDSLMTAFSENTLDSGASSIFSGAGATATTTTTTASTSGSTRGTNPYARSRKAGGRAVPIKNQAQQASPVVTQAQPSSQMPQPQKQPETKSNEPISKLARAKKGAAALGKSAVRPIYDFDKSGKYNGKRLVRNIGRAALGASLGIAAAAVQAGISITDGKYSPLEGAAALATGYAGAGKIFDSAGNLKEIYDEGALAGDKAGQMERIKETYADRDDVIEYNKRNYAGREKEMAERQKENWLEYGYYNPKDMKSGIKYADQWIKDNYGDISGKSAAEQKAIIKEADARAVQTMKFKKTLESQGQSKSIYDESKRNKYIEEMVRQEAGPNASNADKDRIRTRYKNAFNAIVEYDNAQ